MRIVFILIFLLGLSYFLLAKRRFDFFSLAFISACIYFLPGLVGYSIYPHTLILDKKVPVPLIGDAYLVMILVMASIVLGGIFFDLYDKGGGGKNIGIPGSKNAVMIAIILAIAGFVLTMASSGGQLFNPNKQYVMDVTGRWHVLWVFGSSLAAALSFSHSNRKYRRTITPVCLLLLLIDVLIGFRSSFALAIISLFTIQFFLKGKQRLLTNNLRLGFLAVFGAAFLFIYKYIYVAVKLGHWERIIEDVFGLDLYRRAFLESEPFITQMILNGVMRADLHVGLEHFKSLVYQVLFFAPDLGGNITSFNDLFQSTLFPYAKAGMASNIWAEMWSSGGWALLILFIIIFNLVLFIGSYLLVNVSSSLRGGVVLLFSYWSFYIHRNDLMYQLNLEKRVLILWMFCILVSIIISNNLFKSKKGI